MRENTLTIEDVDKRVTQTLNIFKTFLVQNIDKSILDTLNDKTASLDRDYAEMAAELKSFEGTVEKRVEESSNQLMEEIQALREECRAVVETIVREEVIKQ